MQKKRVAIGMVFMFLSLLPQTGNSQEAAPPPVVITELGIFENAESEWIEIYNRSDRTADLTGWKFFEDSTNHGLSVFRGETALLAKHFAVIANKAEIFAQKYPEYTGTIFDSSWGSLKNEGEEIGLKDSTGAMMELFTYPASTGTTSLERKNPDLPPEETTNWQHHPVLHSLNAMPETETTSPNPIPESNAASTETAPEDATPLPPITPEPQNAPPLAASSEPTPASTTPPSTPPSIYAGTTQIVSPSAPSHATAAPPTTSSAKKSTDAPAPSSVPPAPQIFDPSPTQLIAVPPFELRGYFLFVPQNFAAYQPMPAKISSAQKKKKAAPKTSKKATAPKKKPKTVQPKKIPTVLPAISDEIIPGDIIITEIYPAPENHEEEWIELFNAGSSTISLGGWSLTDGSQKTHPYLIPEETIIGPNEYLLLPKSLTKIALNNEQDNVFLADAEFNGRANVAYHNAEKGKSYALLRQKIAADFVASSIPLSLRKPSSWEWISKKTPGAHNPSYERLDGTVTRLLAGGKGNTAVHIQEKTGEEKIIRFDDSTLNPEIAGLLLTPGAEISMDALMDDEIGGYRLNAITNITPPPPAKKRNWTLIAALMLAGTGALFFIRPFLPEKWR